MVEGEGRDEGMGDDLRRRICGEVSVTEDAVFMLETMAFARQDRWGDAL